MPRVESSKRRDRFAVPYRVWIAAGRTELFGPESPVDAALNAVLVLSILLPISSVAYAVALPKTGESFTDFYLLTENDTGHLVAADYPTEFTHGETQSIVVGVSNHEHRRVNYSVMVLLQDVSLENNSTTVHREVELDRFQLRLANNETRNLRYDVTPTRTGTRLRLAFLLYQGPPQIQPSVESAYRETHLWINVTETG